MAEPTPTNPSGAEVPARSRAQNTGVVQQSPQSAQEQQHAREERARVAKENAEKVVADAEKRHNEIVQQYYENHPDTAKPTPTPREIAMAAAGNPVLEKEDSGSPVYEIGTRVYKTRDQRADRDQQRADRK